ncbi:MAG TPA: M56 family metallopeptidase [Terriglobia bacterium]|nr:M56 family metallopeptidase [Terriglobia bacterium]
MNSLQSFVASPLAGAIGWALLHSLWEGAVISGALGAALVALRSPRSRYMASCAALLALLATFGFTLVWIMPEAAHGIRAYNYSLLPAWNAPVVNDAQMTWGMRLAGIAPWLAPFWIVGVLLIYLRRTAGFISARKLRRRGVCCAPVRWQEELARLSVRLRISRPVKLLESCLADVPMVLGHFRPLILMPVGLLAGLPAGQIDAILLHELAHIRRCDYLVNVLQRFIEGLFFYHPAAWWFSRVIRAERENCCDDVAVSALGRPHDYALALAALEESRFSNREPAVALTGGNLMKRIRRLLCPKPAGPWAPFLAALIVVVTTTIAVAAWQAKTPSRSLTAAESATQKELNSPYADFINGPTQYIITRQERIAFLQLTTDEERTRFIQQFWERRNPNPGAPDNVFKDEFYRRVAYADQHFAYSGIPGWKTDRGHYWIAWGIPDQMIHYVKGFHGPYAAEIWHYHFIPGIGQDVQLTFVNSAGNGDFKLTFKLSDVPAISPPASKQRAVKVTAGSVVVTIGKTQTLYIGNQPANLHNLGSIVQEKLDGNLTAPVYVRAAGSVPWSVVMTVMDTLKQSRISNVHIVTQPLETQRTPIIRSIDYKGINPLTVADVTQRLEKIGLGVMRPYDPNQAGEAIQAIFELYRQRGILVNVDVKELPIPPDSIALTFVISKR